MMNTQLKEQWLEILRNGTNDNDFGQVSDLSEFNDSVPPSYCALGVLMDMENAMTKPNKYKYKRTLRVRIRSFRERVGIKIGSKIAGFDLTPYDEYDY